jgi:hypothetical protein
MGQRSTPTKPHVSCSNEEQPRRWSSRSPVDPGQHRNQLARLLTSGVGLAIEPETSELISTNEAMLALGKDHAFDDRLPRCPESSREQLNFVLGPSAVTGVTGGEVRAFCFA